MTIDGGRGSGPGPWGYVIVLVGVALFGVACFLPYYSVENAPPGYTATLYRLQTMRMGGLGPLGGILFLFSGPVALAFVASLGIWRSKGWAAAALVAMTVVWALSWIGILLNGGSLFPDKEIGYWLLLAAVVVVAVGAAMVAFSRRVTAVPDQRHEGPTTVPAND